MPAAAHLEPWSPDDDELLMALNGDPAQMAHLGGAETAAKIADRHARYVTDPFQFAVVDEATGTRAGWVGFWAREWRGATVFEIGWSVLPAFHGRGLASAATVLAVEEARRSGGAPAVHAFPGVDNAPSNAVCRRAGFTLVEEALEFEYPPGTLMRCNDWRLALA